MDNNKPTFHSWVKKNQQSIEHALLSEAYDFLSECAEENLTINELQLDNKWHYLNAKKNKGYNGALFINNNSVPILKLTYHSFKQGGDSQTFDSKKVLKALWQNEQKGEVKPFKHLIKRKVDKTNKPDVTKVNDDLKLWEALKTTGDSDYLVRKKINPRTEVKGLKFGHNLVAVKIVDAEGRGHGLQKIYNDGQKRFTKGLAKKGKFALIGQSSLAKTSKRVSICEGVSTALSIHLATGEPVCAALDAFNLLPVAKTLKKHCKKAEFIFWADNDAYKATKLKPNGEPIGNTGLIHANHAALKMRKAKVMVPEFKEDTITQSLSKPTDFNDLHVLEGLDAITLTKAKKPDVRFALHHELKKSKKNVLELFNPAQFKKAEFKTYNHRYLPDDLTIKEGINLIRSPIGTGKTQAVEKILKENDNLSAIFTTHLISLVESGASRLGLSSYNKCDAFDLQMEKRLAICLNSLAKLIYEGPVPYYDVLVIDEIEQVLTRLNNPLEHKTFIFEVLKELVQSAKYVVCLDAHLSTATIELIKSWANDKPIHLHLNDYEIGHDKTIEIYDNKESLQMSALFALNNKENAYLTFNSKTEALKTFEFFKKTLPNKKGLFISGDNTGDKESLAFFNNVNETSKQYDYIVCTPSVSTGVSIDNNHFQFVAGFFNSTINTANDCAQALGRVRNIAKKHVYCETRRGDKTLNRNLIKTKWHETHQHDLNLMNLTESGDKVLFNQDYERLAIQTTLQKNQSYNNFYESFLLLMLSDGYHFNYATIELEHDEKKLIKSSKEHCFEESQIEQFKQLQPLSEIELKQLEKKTRKTKEETLAFNKRKLSDFFNVNDEETLLTLLNEDNQGKLRKKILLLELGLSSQQLAKKLYEKQYEAYPQFVADLKHYATEQALVKKILNEIQIQIKDNSLKKETLVYDKETLLSSELFGWVKRNYKVLTGIISLPTLNSINTNPIRFMSRLLDLIGLKQKRVGKNENGLYQISEESFEFIKALLSRRNQVLGDSCTNSILSNAESVPSPINIPQKRKKPALLKSITKGFDKLAALIKNNQQASTEKSSKHCLINNIWKIIQSKSELIATKAKNYKDSESVFVPQLFCP